MFNGAIITILILAVILFLFSKNTKTVQIAPSEAKKLWRDQKYVFLDVRTPDEFRTGHIEGALHIPLIEIQGRIKELKNKTGSTIIVYCQSGGRSSSACQILQRNGVSEIANLKGGISAWIAAGNSIVTI